MTKHNTALGGENYMNLARIAMEFYEFLCPSCRTEV
jgi:hypothetical protein